MYKKNIVAAKFKISEDGKIAKIYRHSQGKTGVYVNPYEPRIVDQDTESFFNDFKRISEFELLEITYQVKERVLGNHDEAYETITF